MKRDMDLLRRILFDIEECEGTTGLSGGHLKIDIEGRSPEEVMYHIQLAHEAGLIEVRDVSNMSGIYMYPTRLTWLGHEFVDEARNETIWAKAKKLAAEKGGSLSFEGLKIALGIVVRQALGG
jgi:hypothetical protein